jgi:anti-sigma regulatory factor (Ser/Thr protein kinase)
VVSQACKTFDNSDHAPSEARRFIGECLDARGITEVKARILLAVSELTTNAVVHGSGPIDVAMDATSDRLRVTVTDDGSGTPAPHMPHPGSSEAGGWGLQLVETLADDWGTERRNGRTIVWFEHALPSG